MEREALLEVFLSLCALGFAAIPFFFLGFLVISSSQRVSSPANLPCGSHRISPSARIPNKHCHVWKSPCWAPPFLPQELWLDGDSSQSLPKQQKFPTEPPGSAGAFGCHKMPFPPLWPPDGFSPFFPLFFDFSGHSELLCQQQEQQPGCAIPGGDPKFGNIFFPLQLFPRHTQAGFIPLSSMECILMEKFTFLGILQSRGLGRWLRITISAGQPSLLIS